jgi:hypothetical protein
VVSLPSSIRKLAPVPIVGDLDVDLGVLAF